MSTRFNRTFAMTALTLTLLATEVDAQKRDIREAPVGMRARIEQVVLPGTKLEAKPSDNLNDPLVLRVVDVYPHGTAMRYDLEYYGLEPGRYDLRDQLKRVDGSSMADIEPIFVEINAVLPPGHIEPMALQTDRPPRLGGYRTLLILGGVLWIIGLLAILFARKRRRDVVDPESLRPRSLADRLRPIVEQAMSGDLDNAGKAELERLLLAYWRRRLGIGDTDVAAAIMTLRRHEEAGALLRQLESWLHMPQPPKGIDVNTLLAPYRDVPAETAEEQAAREAG